MAGVAAWRWLFGLQGVPTLALGLALLTYLPGTPAEAGWLAPADRAALATATPRARAGGQAATAGALGDALRRPSTWLLALHWFAVCMMTFAITFFLPLLLTLTLSQSRSLPLPGPLAYLTSYHYS